MLIPWLQTCGHVNAPSVVLAEYKDTAGGYRDRVHS